MVSEDCGWVVQTYTTGMAFLASLCGFRPLDCLVFDPEVPDVNTLELVRVLNNLKGTIPIIGLTATTDDALIQDIEAAGAWIILTKPVSAEEFIKQVNIAINSSKDAY